MTSITYKTQRAISVLEKLYILRNVIKPKWGRVKLYSNKREARKNNFLKTK